MMFFVWPLLLLIAIAMFWYWGKEQQDTLQLKEDEDLLEMLERRYARGEISKEEFEWGKKLLQNEI